MTTETKYTLPSHTRKTWELYQLLAGHVLHGLAPGEIATALGVSPSWVSTTLPALAAETGAVERVGDANRWRLGVPFVRIANTVSTELGNAQRRLTEMGNRYAVPLN